VALLHWSRVTWRANSQPFFVHWIVAFSASNALDARKRSTNAVHGMRMPSILSFICGFTFTTRPANVTVPAASFTAVTRPVTERRELSEENASVTIPFMFMKPCVKTQPDVP